MFKILIAEDDSELRQLFSHVLIKNGYSVTGVCNGKEALDALDKGYYDLIISDIMMPEMDGYELVSSLRTAGYSIPVMMITAKDAFDDMRMGFVSDTDDYMVKPIEFDEMIMRIKAILRRTGIAQSKRLVIGSTVLDREERSAYVDGVEISLTPREFDIVFKLLSYPKKTFSRQAIMDEFWDSETTSSTRTVDVYVTKLRDKFSLSKDFEIQTVHGLGYKAVLL